MMYSVQRLSDTRLAVVLVERRDLMEPRASFLIDQLQDDLSLPVLLVARDVETCTGVRAKAEFDPAPYVYALFGIRDIEWVPLTTACSRLEAINV